MKPKKQQFYVFAPVAIFIIVMAVISNTIFILMMTVGRNETVTTGVIITGSLMLMILPTGLFIWAILYLLPVVRIDAFGIHRSLFGLMKKTIAWHECQEIAMISTPTQGWLFFSESEVIVKGNGFWALSKYRLKRDNIFLASNQKVLDAVERFAPQHLLPICYKN